MNFSFAHIWIFLLLPLPWLIQRFLKAYDPARPAVRVPWFEKLARFAGSSGEKEQMITLRSPIKKAVSSVSWLLLLCALARPQYLEPPIFRTMPSTDMLLIVDLSGSMEAEDFTNSEGEKVDRLTAVKDVLDDFLIKREGDRVGLIVFGSAAFVQVPFTQDLAACRLLLAETAPGMAGPQTALGDAVGLGITLFERSDMDQKVMIALTDGNDTKSRVTPTEAARIAADKDIVLYTVAVGDPTAVGEEKLDEETLKKMAQTTGGKYYFAGDRDQLETIYTELDQLETRELESVSYRPRLDLFQWPLLAALLLNMAVYLRRVLQSIHRSGKVAA